MYRGNINIYIYIYINFGFFSYTSLQNMNKSLQGKSGKELEQEGKCIFEAIGLDCFNDLGQVQLKDIAPEYPNNEHLEFDYMIPIDKVCLIGEITSRDEGKINTKYKKFINQINIIKKLEFSDYIWQKLGIKTEHIRKFRNIQSIKGFFITTTAEEGNGEGKIDLPEARDIVKFYKSDYMRLKEYSDDIGEYTRNYFLNLFKIDDEIDKTSISIDKKYHQLIRSTNKQISKKDNDAPLSDLYTFTISPYKILNIVRVYRQDELPSLEDSSTYNYQRPLIPDKLKKIRENLLTNPDFIFPSNILVVLSKECTYDERNDGCLYIPRKYGSISVIDGQHRLFSYADQKVKSIMQNDCKIMVTAVDFKTENQEIINKFSAKVFLEINMNQTKVEITHTDKIAYELGSKEPKVIATKIIVNLNTRQNFKQFFNLTSDKANKGIIDAGIIIEAIKKITNITKIEQLTKAKVRNTLLKKDGYEKLFDSTIEKLSEKETLVEKGTALFERYFNYIFSTFNRDEDNLKSRNKTRNTSFIYSKFWGGWINLLIIFIEEGLDWEEIRQELNNIKKNVMALLEITEAAYNESLFQRDHPKIPDASSSPIKIRDFLNKNRKESCSIQDVEK